MPAVAFASITAFSSAFSVDVLQLAIDGEGERGALRVSWVGSRRW